MMAVLHLYLKFMTRFITVLVLCYHQMMGLQNLYSCIYTTQQMRYVTGKNALPLMMVLMDPLNHLL
jgi:hypothetical protein